MATEMPVIKNRNGSADLIKGVAVLLMVQVHILEQFATNDLYNSTLGKISLFLGGPACAPVFMAVMGYYLATTKKTFIGLLLRGVFLFVGGILLNIGRSANLLLMIYKGESGLNPWQYIFGADILTLAGLSVMAIAFLRFVFKAHYLPYLLTAFIIAALSPYLYNDLSVSGYDRYFFAFLRGGVEWSFFPLFPWMAYVLVGYAFRLFTGRAEWVKQVNFSNQLFYIIPLWFIVLVTIPWAAGITANLNGPGGYYHHGILFFAWVILFIFSYLLIFLLVEPEFGDHGMSRMVKWMGARVTLFYIIQWLIIGNLAPLFYRSQHLFQVIAWLPAVLVMSGIVVYLLQKSLMTVQK